MPIAYAAEVGSYTLFLDEEGICVRVDVFHEETEGGASPDERYRGAQFVAALDVTAPGGLLPLPAVGAQLLLGRVTDGRIALLRTRAVTKFVDYTERRLVPPPPPSRPSRPAPRLAAPPPPVAPREDPPSRRTPSNPYAPRPGGTEPPPPPAIRVAGAPRPPAPPPPPSIPPARPAAPIPPAPPSIPPARAAVEPATPAGPLSQVFSLAQLAGQPERRPPTMPPPHRRPTIAPRSDRPPPPRDDER